MAVHCTVAAGLSFTCARAQQGSTVLCANTRQYSRTVRNSTATNAGGHLSDALGAWGNCDASDPCTVAKCCAASDPAVFSQVCAGLEAAGMTEDYINVGCCLAC